MPISGKVPPKFTPRQGTGERFDVKPGLYYVKLLEVDEAPPQPGRNPEWGNSWQWRFMVSDVSGKVVTSQNSGSDGLPQPLPMIQFTSDKMGVSPAGKKARGRAWFEALLRRELGDNEDLTEVAQDALGKVAQAFITLETSKAGTTYCAISQMIPATDEVLEKVRAKDAALSAGGTTATDEVPF